MYSLRLQTPLCVRQSVRQIDRQIDRSLRQQSLTQALLLRPDAPVGEKAHPLDSSTGPAFEQYGAVAVIK